MSLFIVLFLFPPGELLLSCRHAFFCVWFLYTHSPNTRFCVLLLLLLLFFFGGMCVMIETGVREVSGSRALTLVSIEVCRGHTLHDVAVGGDDVSCLRAVAVCVSGCLLLAERRYVQPDDHLLLEVVEEHSVIGEQLVGAEDGLLLVFTQLLVVLHEAPSSPYDSLWKIPPYGQRVLGRQESS